MIPPDHMDIEVTSSTGPDLTVQVTLTMDKNFKPGALYTGTIFINGIPFVMKAIGLCSAAGGRMLVAFDERLDVIWDRGVSAFVEGPLARTVVMPWAEYGIVVLPESE